jgi:hypothetical protein
VVTETDLELPDGRTLHVYDTAGDGGEERLAVLWHHGTPNLGAPPDPLLPAAARPELWLRPEDGHSSVLASAEDALRWLRERQPGPSSVRRSPRVPHRPAG